MSAHANDVTLPTGERITLGAARGRLVAGLMVVGGAGLALALGLALAGGQQGMRYFLHSYLTSYVFYLSLSLGGLFFVAVQHVTRAGWSVTVRRQAEILAASMPVLIVLFLPIFLPVVRGSHALYEWNDPAAVAHDELLNAKVPYLNMPFFVVRCVIYFAVWWFLGRYYYSRSLRQDETGDPAWTLRMERISPVALILFALTVTFFSFDVLMSLTPHWFSTIYGVYYFAGCVVGVLCVLILASVGLQASGRLTDSITDEHYHDLGKLLLGFVIFWGYIAFSQYMLIWYANIPEETSWYLARQTGGWVWVALLLLFSHLLIPFVGLLPRAAKRNRAVLAFWAVWLLAAHWLDMYYLVMPSLGAESLPVSPIDACLLLGIGGIYVAGVIRTAGTHALVPHHDPRLGEALTFAENF